MKGGDHQFFCDESGTQGGARHLLIGMLCTTNAERRHLLDIIQRIRTEERFNNELHWTKVSAHRERVYCRVFSETMEHVRYRAIHVDRQVIDLQTCFSGQWHVAVNRFTRMLVEKNVRPGTQALLYLDYRTAEARDNRLARLHREINGEKPDGVRAVELQDSKLSPLMQLSDLYLGAIGHGVNLGRVDPIVCMDDPPRASRKDRIYVHFTEVVREHGGCSGIGYWRWRPNDPCPQKRRAGPILSD